MAISGKTQMNYWKWMNTIPVLKTQAGLLMTNKDVPKDNVKLHTQNPGESGCFSLCLVTESLNRIFCINVSPLSGFQPDPIIFCLGLDCPDINTMG